MNVQQLSLRLVGLFSLILGLMVGSAEGAPRHPALPKLWPSSARIAAAIPARSRATLRWQPGRQITAGSIRRRPPGDLVAADQIAVARIEGPGPADTTPSTWAAGQPTPRTTSASTPRPSPPQRHARLRLPPADQRGRPIYSRWPNFARGAGDLREY